MAIESGVKIAIAIAGAAISAKGAIDQGNAADQSARFEATQLEQQAQRDREIAAQEADDSRDNEARRRATLRANVGGSGITFEGTPLAILSDLAGEAEFQARRIEAGGETAAIRAENAARIRRFEGGQSRQAGFTRAGASLLSAGARSFGRTGTTVPSVRTDAAGRVLGGI